STNVCCPERPAIVGRSILDDCRTRRQHSPNCGSCPKMKQKLCSWQSWPRERTGTDVHTLAEASEDLSPLKRALLELRELRSRLAQLERRSRDPIAIVGLGCRFPGGVNDAESFWRLLHNGVDAITEVPHERWRLDAYFDVDPETPGKMSTRFGA